MRCVKQISSLEKVRRQSDMQYYEVKKKTLLRGERFSYQIAASRDIYYLPQMNASMVGKLEVDSPLSPYIRIFHVENAVMDCPLTEVNAGLESNYITREPGLMPDILVPAEEKEYIWDINVMAGSIWVELNVPEDLEPGTYDIHIILRAMDRSSMALSEDCHFRKTLTVDILPQTIAAQTLIYTRWFYADCVADYHNVPIYSEAHWQLMEGYIKVAVDCGVNMILVPVHTPPLDTAIGLTRPCVQLVDIRKEGDRYIFCFDKFHRFVQMCKKCGVEYFEIAHLFSQWGAKCAPNIMVEENGKTDYLFGWHIASDSQLYTDFLKQYIAAIHEALVAAGIEESTYFHISDEPNLNNLDSYQRAYNTIRPLIRNSKTFDALSSYEFYQKGLVECPVTTVRTIDTFLDKNIPNQWAYYCCWPQSVHTNSTLAMPSSRVRILGFLLYRYDIKGFLHWGLNYYNSRVSRFSLNPYVTTSAFGAYPSGDPFILYPAKDGAYSSIRGKVIYDAITDMRLCQTLEVYIGREAVVELIDQYAGGQLKFDDFPVGNEYIETLNERIKERIREIGGDEHN